MQAYDPSPGAPASREEERAVLKRTEGQRGRLRALAGVLPRKAVVVSEPVFAASLVRSDGAEDKGRSRACRGCRSFAQRLSVASTDSPRCMAQPAVRSATLLIPSTRPHQLARPHHAALGVPLPVLPFPSGVPRASPAHPADAHEARTVRPAGRHHPPAVGKARTACVATRALPPLAVWTASALGHRRQHAARPGAAACQTGASQEGSWHSQR